MNKASRVMSGAANLEPSAQGCDLVCGHAGHAEIRGPRLDVQGIACRADPHAPEQCVGRGGPEAAMEVDLSVMPIFHGGCPDRGQCPEQADIDRSDLVLAPVAHEPEERVHPVHVVAACIEEADPQDFARVGVAQIEDWRDRGDQLVELRSGSRRIGQPRQGGEAKHAEGTACHDAGDETASLHGGLQVMEECAFLLPWHVHA